MRRGAVDTCANLAAEQLQQTLKRVEESRRLENRLAELESQMDHDSPEIDLATQSPTLQQTLEIAFKAGERGDILLLGEAARGRVCCSRHSSTQPRAGGRLSR